MTSENQNQDQRPEKEDEKQKSLQSSDKEVIEQRNPPEDAEAISNAGKKRDEGRRYQ